MTVFRVFIVLGWIALVAITAATAAKNGWAGSLSDFSMNYEQVGWQAMYNADFLAHVALIGLWVGWRHGWTPLGIALALCAAFGGALFTYAYLLTLTVIAKGDMRRVVLGVRA